MTPRKEQPKVPEKTTNITFEAIGMKKTCVTVGKHIYICDMEPVDSEYLADPTKEKYELL